MPPVGPIDENTLEKLRGLVARLHAEHGSAVPVEKIVQLADEVRLDAGLTVDFEASRTLGTPMVVLRMSPDSPNPGCDSPLKALSRREREVAGLIAEGLSNKQIAARLFLSLATVKDHVHRILEKSGLPNRAAVAATCRAAVIGRNAAG